MTTKRIPQLYYATTDATSNECRKTLAQQVHLETDRVVRESAVHRGLYQMADSLLLLDGIDHPSVALGR